MCRSLPRFGVPLAKKKFVVMLLGEKRGERRRERERDKEGTKKLQGRDFSSKKR